jgi:hypothetical protein
MMTTISQHDFELPTIGPAPYGPDARLRFEQFVMKCRGLDFKGRGQKSGTGASLRLSIGVRCRSHRRPCPPVVVGAHMDSPWLLAPSDGPTVNGRVRATQLD